MVPITAVTLSAVLSLVPDTAVGPNAATPTADPLALTPVIPLALTPVLPLAFTPIPLPPVAFNPMPLTLVAYMPQPLPACDPQTPMPKPPVPLF